MLLDGLSSSHPISQEVDRATDIDRVFDWIAYKKVRELASKITANISISLSENDKTMVDVIPLIFLNVSLC